MTQDVSKQRLERLRQDLAALRARTTAEFGLPVADPPPADPDVDGPDPATTSHTPADDDHQPWGPTRRFQPRPDAAPPVPSPTNGAARTAPDTGHPPSATPPIARPIAPQDTQPDAAGTAERIRAVIGLERRPRPPRPPRRLWRPRARRPATRTAVPARIPVRPRAAYLAAPRWPLWNLPSCLAAGVVLLPALWQLTHRLLHAMRDTSVLLGADPTRADFLHAAAGVAGGGLTLALAIVTLAVVKGRVGYLGAALGVVSFFCIFPYIAYTANAGIVSAPVPPLDRMVQPPGWPSQTQLGLVFWLSLAAAAAALVDLLVRSAGALGRSLRR